MQLLSKGRGATALKAEINVTPLVDVVLVLLIIFMVVTPLLSQGRSVELPLASTVEVDGEPSNAIVLTVRGDKRLLVANREVSLEQLASELEEQRLREPGREVLIRADAGVSVGDLRPVLQALKAAHLTQISFAVRQRRAEP